MANVSSEDQFFGDRQSIFKQQNAIAYWFYPILRTYIEKQRIDFKFAKKTFRHLWISKPDNRDPCTKFVLSAYNKKN
ncbi:MAG: hypothetical protein VKJ02_07700 [Snowella sp.]|nr:hypothetical protein [Snowella sp.]